MPTLAELRNEAKRDVAYLVKRMKPDEVELPAAILSPLQLNQVIESAIDKGEQIGLMSSAAKWEAHIKTEANKRSAKRWSALSANKPKIGALVLTSGGFALLVSEFSRADPLTVFMALLMVSLAGLALLRKN